MPGVLSALLGSVAPLVVQYLIVAGGGGGGSSGVNYGGGGGAGGYRSSVLGEVTGGGGSPEQMIYPTVGTQYSVTVGGGGGGNANGSNSSVFGIVSTGGGRGRGDAYGAQGFTGGSGGGGTYVSGLGGLRTTTPIQGNRGGVGASAGNPPPQSNAGSGGGGGAGSPGLDLELPGFFRNSEGAGGQGLQSSITGSSTFYAAGGVGSSYYLGSRTNNIGGGATGGVTGGSISNAGTINTGSGGGGGVNGAGGVGGSGVVILRYPNNYHITFGAGLIANTSLIGTSQKATRITSGTGNLTFQTTPNTLSSALDSSSYTGLIGQFFNGDWRSTISTGNIGTLPLSSPTTYSSISYGTRGDLYGFIAIGYFKPPTTGTYTFFTSSDDGSGVWVGSLASAASGRTAENATLNNNLGGGQGDTKRSGTASLTAGIWYPIRIVHEEGAGGDNLTFSWSGPGIAETTSLSTHFKRPVNLEVVPINTFL
jgi:hypothetical protein